MKMNCFFITVYANLSLFNNNLPIQTSKMSSKIELKRKSGQLFNRAKFIHLIAYNPLNPPPPPQKKAVLWDVVSSEKG